MHLFVAAEEMVYLAPKFGRADVAEVAGPCHVEHLLQGKRCDFEELSNAGVGVGNDCMAFPPALLPLHHDVAVWERFVEREQLAVVFGDLLWCVVSHLVLDLVRRFVK